MALKIRSIKDFSAGLMFIGIGAVFGIGATQYPMGTAVRMGPAYFPTWLGGLLTLLGLIGTVAIVVYHIDQRPKLQEASTPRW